MEEAMEEIVSLLGLDSFFVLLVLLWLVAGVFSVYIIWLSPAKKVKLSGRILFAAVFALIAISTLSIYNLLGNLHELLVRAAILACLAALAVLAFFAVKDFPEFGPRREAMRAGFVAAFGINIVLIGAMQFSASLLVYVAAEAAVTALSFFIYVFYSKFFIYALENGKKVFIVYRDDKEKEERK